MTGSKQTSHRRAKPFRQTRKDHSLEAAEDYTELIADLIEEHGEARTGKVAERLGISHVTALRTIQRLQKEGFVRTEPHRPIILTARGKKLAAFSKERHELLVDFLRAIGVPAEVAELDVEGIEHHVSEVTLSYVRRFLKKR